MSLDDSWRNTYDAWKLASPDDYDREPEDECDHEEYETDILSGRAECCKCPHSWYLTDEDMLAEVRRIRDYEDWQRRENLREFWRKVTYPIRWPIFRLFERIWPRKAHNILTDDELPF